MSEDTNQTRPLPSPSQSGEEGGRESFSREVRIGTMLNEFASAWLAGNNPSLDEYLARVPDEEQPKLRVELLRLEAELNTSTKSTSGDGPENPTVQVPAQTLPPGSLFGRYRILRELGRGAMGCVLLAEDTELNRKVALKIPTFREGDEAVLSERFRHGQPKEIRLGHAEEALGMKVLKSIPDDPKTINRSINNGVPVVLDAPRMPVSRSFNELAQAVHQELTKKTTR